MNETASGWQRVNFASPVNISANTTYVASYHTTSGYYSSNQQYFTAQYDNAPLHALADAASGGNGLWQTSGTPTFPAQNYRASNFWVDVVFGQAIAPAPSVTATAPTGAYTIWSNAISPSTTSEADPRAIEVGVKFKSDVAGGISGIRFYKGPLNTGTHTVSLWTAGGALLARSVSVSETASGWQQVNFASPVNISANTTYIASYHTTSGYYSSNEQYFTAQYDNPPLHALADAASGGNGVWQTSSTPTFPTQNYRAGNFWVDVVFATSSCGATLSGTITLAASALDDVGVVGVQFKLDGGNYGLELMTTPYSIPLKTTALPSGCHVITAVARDAAGNQGVASRLVNVSNP